MAIESTFKPAWWLPGGHLQTLWASLVRSRIHVPVRRERIELADGDFIDLDWTTHEHGPVVLILHGLQGSSESNYARGLMAACHDRGWRALVLHFRGCSGEPNRLPRAYHSGETGDLQYIINELAKREPDTPVITIGYSLGGNVLLKWLGESCAPSIVKAAAAISVPYDLKNGVTKLDNGISRLYQRHLLNSLKRSAQRKSSLLSGLLDHDEILSLRSIYEFDNKITAPLHGFKDADEYYSVCSSRQYLKNIQLPTLLLHASDDPFMTVAAIPLEKELSAMTTLELSPHGGHVGFVAGNWPWSARYWLEDRLLEFIAGYFAQD